MRVVRIVIATLVTSAAAFVALIAWTTCAISAASDGGSVTRQWGYPRPYYTSWVRYEHMSFVGSGWTVHYLHLALLVGVTALMALGVAMLWRRGLRQPQAGFPVETQPIVADFRVQE